MTSQPAVEKRRGCYFHILVFLAGLVVSGSFLWVPADWEMRIRTAGGVLQLLGMVSVGLGILELLSQFDLPNIWTEFRTETSVLWKRWLATLRQRLGIRGKTQHISGVGGLRSGARVGGIAEVEVKPGPNATIERRVELLELRIDELGKLARQTGTDLRNEAAERVRVQTAEATERRTAITALTGEVKSFAVGGIKLEIVGWLWLFLGTLMSSWSKELAP